MLDSITKNTLSAIITAFIHLGGRLSMNESAIAIDCEKPDQPYQYSGVSQSKGVWRRSMVGGVSLTVQQSSALSALNGWPGKHGK